MQESFLLLLLLLPVPPNPKAPVHAAQSLTAAPDSRLDAKDAEAHTVPHICLASPGEPADVVAQYKEILSRPGKVGEVETYTTMFHGWMGARANLAKEDNLAEYERGYKQVADFFNAHL